jgi:uncharacterized protein (UPF0179 family)
MLHGLPAAIYIQMVEVALSLHFQCFSCRLCHICVSKMGTKTKVTVEGLDDDTAIELEVKANGIEVSHFRLITPVRNRKALIGALRQMEKANSKYVIEVQTKGIGVSLTAHLDPKRSVQIREIPLGSRKITVSAKVDKEVDYLWDSEGANRIFRSKDDFISWLKRPHVALQGQIPLNVLKTDRDAVGALIIRLIHGILA